MFDLDFFEDMLVDVEGSGGLGDDGKGGKRPAIKVTGMPGKHVPPGVLGTLNDLISAVSFSLPFNFFFSQIERWGWMDVWERGALWSLMMQRIGPADEWMDA